MLGTTSDNHIHCSYHAALVSSAYLADLNLGKMTHKLLLGLQRNQKLRSISYPSIHDHADTDLSLKEWFQDLVGPRELSRVICHFSEVE